SGSVFTGELGWTARFTFPYRFWRRVSLGVGSICIDLVLLVCVVLAFCLGFSATANPVHAQVGRCGLCSLDARRL
ncbi:unnamed protein product, partial [Brassica rapa subsp. trilocularis]